MEPSFLYVSGDSVLVTGRDSQSEGSVVLEVYTWDEQSDEFVEESGRF